MDQGVGLIAVLGCPAGRSSAIEPVAGLRQE
jgi:hypothetical protein